MFGWRIIRSIPTGLLTVNTINMHIFYIRTGNVQAFNILLLSVFGIHWSDDDGGAGSGAST